jgi:hypothetical protein
MDIWLIAAVVFAVLLVGATLLTALVKWAAHVANDELDPASPKNYGRRRTDRIRDPETEKHEAEARTRAQFNLECD